MKFETPINPNYVATVVKIKKITKLANCDNVVGLPFFGYQAIASDVKVGDLGVVFSTETQLSDVYCKVNNLYRHSELNLDTTKKGYLEDNRRIKAVKFRGHTSNALFMPLESLTDFGVDVSTLEEGDEFDFLNGIEVCRKYIAWTPERRTRVAEQLKKSRVDQKHLPMHFSTSNFYKEVSQFSGEQDVIVTQKLHGTSVRIAHTYVTRKLSVVDKVAKFFGATVKEMEMDYVFGSRKVIKDANNPDQKHYYDTDIWSIEGKQYIGVIPENYIVYAEIIGKLPNGNPIQSGYTYGLNNSKVYVYRVATINQQGQTTDLSWDLVKEFCEINGMLAVPELWRGKLKDFKKKTTLKKFIDVRLADKFDCLPVDTDMVDEGVCIRIDHLTPYIMKAKSPKFYEWETAQMDKEVEDVEAEQ